MQKSSGKKTTGRIIVRTGCIVCKARRVKCDERKPTCLRCEKANRVCEGYRILPKASQSASDSRSLVPRAGSSLSDTSNASSSSFNNSLHNASTPLIPFENEQQRRYFEIFRKETAKQLAGYMESSLWDEIIPRACETEPSIRHAVFALGALDFTLPSQMSGQGASEQHDFALREYHHAIRLLREKSANGKVELRTALLACICCVCFEEFHGDCESALGQVYTGVNLMHCISKDLGGMIVDFVKGCKTMPQLEEEIVSALQLLAAGGMSLSDPRPISYHSEYRMAGQDIMNAMPLVFGDYSEARRYRNLIILRSWHFQRHLTQYDFEYDGSQCPKFAWEVFDAVSHPLSQIPAGVAEEHRIHVMELARWQEAFSPLLRRAQTETTHPDFILANTLQIHLLACSIIIENALSVFQVSYDDYLATFSEILDIVTVLLAHKDHSTKKGCYTFYNQYIIATCVCALKCRYRPIRQKAMSILLSSHQREGLWDSFFAAKILDWVIGLEEQGMDEAGYIPESARARAVHADFDLQQRKAWVSCRVPREDGTLGLKETEISW